MLLYFWLEEDTSSNIELAHPLNPMQPHNVHYALHNIQGKHHSNCCRKEYYTSEN